MRAVGRILIAIVAFVASLVAATIFLFVARFGLSSTPVDPAGVAEYAIWIGLATSMLGAAAFAPAALFILVTEILGVRSMIVHVGAGGVLGGAAAIGRLILIDAADHALMLTAAGLVGGFVYWIIAGRGAGLTAPEPSPPAPTG